jgi:hypothetical protein
MKPYSSILLASLFLFSGCELTDKLDREVDRIKHQYSEYTGNEEDRGERPFEIVYQTDESDVRAILSASCTSNQTPQYVYFETPTDAHTQFYSATQNLISSPLPGTLKPYWDIRYLNPMSRYIYNSDASNYPNHALYTGLDARSGSNYTTIGTNLSQIDASGSVAQSKCVDNQIVAGTNLNLYDAPNQSIAYGGPQSTFAYNFSQNAHIAPWQANGDGNLMLQTSFDKPLYFNYGGNYGGSVSYGIILRNTRTGKLLNYIIGLYAAGDAWQKEKAGIRFDPTTNIVHVATVASKKSWWSTISLKSNAIQEVYSTENQTTKDDGIWPEFYRVNISYQNLLAVLNELKINPPASTENQDFGLQPEEWEITSIMLQYELEEDAGKAMLAGSFKGFSAYISHLPL